MASDSEHALPDEKADWERAEKAVGRLIAAHYSLKREGGLERLSEPRDASGTAGSVSAPAAPGSGWKWPTVILLSVVWLSIGLVVSAAILSIAMLL